MSKETPEVIKRILAGELSSDEEDAYIALNYAISCLEQAREQLGTPKYSVMMVNFNMARHFIKRAIKKAL